MAALIDDQNFTCGICLELAEDAVETTCCHQLFCKKCTTDIDSCPICRKHLEVGPSHFVRRIIGQIKKPCLFCEDLFELGEMKSHQERCGKRPVQCLFDFCDFSGSKVEFLDHLVVIHDSDLVNKNFKMVSTCTVDVGSKVNERDLICRKDNNAGREARLGASGKYYCGRASDTRCGCCNGRCGPSDGCNCSSCFRLDLATRSMPSGYVVNKEGFASRAGDVWQGRVRFYCGRKVMASRTVSGCYTDGWCGDDDGENCASCGIVQQQVEVGGCYHGISNTCLQGC